MAKKMGSKKGTSKKDKMVSEDPEEMMNKKMVGKKKPGKMKK